MRTLVLAATAALVLAVAPVAAAKEIKRAQVCGPDDCTNVDKGNLALVAEGGPPRTPPTAAPYYDIRITMAEGQEEGSFSVAAVPARHAMRGDDGTWMEMPPALTAVVRKLADGQRPFPAGELTGAAPESPAPAPEPAPGDSPLWPEGVIVALVAVAAAFAARGAWLRAAARRA